MTDPNQTPNDPQDGEPKGPQGSGPQGPGPQGPGPQGPGPQPPTKLGKNLMRVALVVFAIILFTTFFQGGYDKGREITITDFWTFVDAGQVTGDIIVEKDTIVGENTRNVTIPDGQPYKFHVQYNHRDDYEFTKKLYAASEKYRGKFEVIFKPTGWWEALLPHLLVTALFFFVIWFFVFRRIGAGGGGGGMLGNFGRSKHRLTPKDQTGVTFGDVAGVDEAKDEVREIIEFLQNPQRFRRLGGRIPRGVLLVGEPGCGKTLLAKAIAGEADVPFFSISGSDFVEMFVGVGASRVRDLFKQAKDHSPCIIFLDEIDAVGRRRGASFTGGGHDEREQTLNAILVEMDGFDSSDQVIVIAATNRLDVLDPALTRPGRFDRQIDVPLPDLQGRYEILKIYAEKVKCEPNIDLRKMARGTPMFSGADLAALVNEAAIAATMADKQFIDMSDMEEARDKVRWGRARKSRAIDEVERKCTAYHEAGHALVRVMAPDADPLHKVSIIPRGRMGGATFSLPEKDRYIYTRKYCDSYLAVCFGGRIAEEIFCGDSSSGAGMDIAQATGVARQMVTDWGMSEALGLVHYGNGSEEKQMGMPGKPEYSDKTADLIDQEVKAIVDRAYSAAREMIETNRDKLERLAQALLKYETLGADEVVRIFAGEVIDKPTVADLIGIEQAKIDPPSEDSPPDPGDSPEPESDSDTQNA